MTTMGSYQAKAKLAHLLDLVEKGESVIITRRGRPAARLMPIRAEQYNRQELIDALQAYGKTHRRRLRGLRIRDLIDHGRRY